MRTHTLGRAETNSRRLRRIGRDISAHRRWYILEGLLFIAIGIAAMLMPGVAALTTEVLVGSLLAIGGLVRFFNGISFPHNRWRRIISGIILAVTGGFMLLWPTLGLVALIWFLGALLLIEGAMEIAMAIGFRPARRWGWLLLSGFIAMLLGGFVLTEGMATGIIFIAFMLGISLTLYGISLTTVAINAE